MNGCGSWRWTTLSLYFESKTGIIIFISSLQFLHYFSEVITERLQSYAVTDKGYHRQFIIFHILFFFKLGLCSVFLCIVPTSLFIIGWRNTAISSTLNGSTRWSSDLLLVSFDITGLVSVPLSMRCTWSLEYRYPFLTNFSTSWMTQFSLIFVYVILSRSVSPTIALNIFILVLLIICLVHFVSHLVASPYVSMCLTNVLYIPVLLFSVIYLFRHIVATSTACPRTFYNCPWWYSLLGLRLILWQ